MQITSGIMQESAVKVVIYGPEGIGKSTLASNFPDTLFSDVEGSTKRLNIRRLPRPTSWTMLTEQAKYIKQNPHICKTYVIDTADWAEQLCSADVCSKSHKNGIEDFGYGKGYVYLEEEFGRFLNLLEDLIDIGINVVFTAHAQMRKFEQPDELGSYDRWEMKLEKKTAPLLKEWADMVLFANYKTFVIKTEDKKNKAQGGKRVMYTSHHACWDAKNRYDLPEEIDFSFNAIAHCIPGIVTSSVPSTVETPPAKIETPPVSSSSEMQSNSKPEQETMKQDPPQQTAEDLSSVPKPLADLMKANNVSINEIQQAVASRGYYPEGTPISNYDSSFISGVLVGAWAQVFEMIKNIRESSKYEVPF